jgi:hypothetical protein
VDQVGGAREQSRCKHLASLRGCRFRSNPPPRPITSTAVSDSWQAAGKIAERKKGVPQRLKPRSIGGICGMSKLVPFQNLAFFGGPLVRCLRNSLHKSRSRNAGPSTASAAADFAQDDGAFMKRTLRRFSNYCDVFGGVLCGVFLRKNAT